MMTAKDLCDEIGLMHDAKIQLLLRNVSSLHFENIMYYFPEELGKHIQYNMSKRAYEMFEESVSQMIAPTNIMVDNAIKYIDDYMNAGVFNELWVEYVEEHNKAQHHMWRYNPELTRDDMEFIDN
jgi:hypothetical protein